MTPIKGSLVPKGFFTTTNGAGTVVSGMMPSIDGEDFDYRNSFNEREDDVVTLKTSE